MEETDEIYLIKNVYFKKKKNDIITKNIYFIFYFSKVDD